MTIKLAEALLRRKELEGKVKQLALIKSNLLVDSVVTRAKVSDGFDDITVKYNRVDLKKVTGEYDYYARQLRMCDAVIQQANWTTEVDGSTYMQDYQQPEDAMKVAK